MAKKKKKKISLSSLFVIILLIIAAIGYKYFGNTDAVDDKGEHGQETVSGTLELHVIDVGQADAVLIRCEQGNILFDAGDLSSKNDLIKYLNGLEISEIEYVIFTHPHADHIGGADIVLTTFDVHNVIMPVLADNDVPTTKVYERMIAALEADESINVISAVPDAEYSLGDVKMKILAPNSDDYSNLNNYSVVVKVDFGETSFMLSGDAESISEKEILKRYASSELKCDFYKAAHHGALESNTSDFLKAVSPTIVAISCGEGNSYGHPHSETLARFNDIGATVYRTDLLGTLKFISDGIKVTKVD